MDTTSSSGDYEYRGMLASTWDLWRNDTRGWSDRNLFHALIRQYGEPVLDVGCGTGRLILDFLQLGIDIDGVDNSPEMLAICRAKAETLGLQPQLYQQRMEMLELPRRYRTILVPSSALQLLPDLAVAEQAVRRFYDHLLPGGMMVTPFSFDHQPGEPLERDWELLFERVRPEDGATVRSWTHEWVDPERQQWHSQQRFEVELQGEVIYKEEVESSPGGRWYTQAQAVALFEQAGFEQIQILQGFEQAPAGPEDRLFCVLGVKR